MANRYHLIPKGENWQVIKDGAERASIVTDTKAQGFTLGRELARNNGSEFTIHNKEGKIIESNSYGKDSFPPRG